MTHTTIIKRHMFAPHFYEKVGHYEGSVGFGTVVSILGLSRRIRTVGQTVFVQFTQDRFLTSVTITHNPGQTVLWKVPPTLLLVIWRACNGASLSSCVAEFAWPLVALLYMWIVFDFCLALRQGSLFFFASAAILSSFLLLLVMSSVYFSNPYLPLFSSFVVLILSLTCLVSTEA